MADNRRKYGEVYDWGIHPMAQGAVACYPDNYTFDGRLWDQHPSQVLNGDHVIPDQSNISSFCPDGLRFDWTLVGQDQWQPPTFSHVPQYDFNGHLPGVGHHDGFYDTTILQPQSTYQRTPSISTLSSLSSPITTSSDVRHSRISLWDQADTPDLSHDTTIREPHEQPSNPCADSAPAQDPSALIFPPLPPQREPPMGTVFIAQSPRHANDLYTPTRTRHARANREGWCGFCARWLNLKNSEFNYDKKYNHGICPVTGARFETPKEYKLTSSTKVRRNSVTECWRGLCSHCDAWVGLGSRSLGPTDNADSLVTVISKPSTSTSTKMTAEEEKWASVANHWWRHAFQCHEYARVGGRRSRAGSRSFAATAAAASSDTLGDVGGGKMG